MRIRNYEEEGIDDYMIQPTLHFEALFIRLLYQLVTFTFPLCENIALH